MALLSALQVGVEIYRHNKRNEPIYYEKLIDILKDTIDERQIFKDLCNLYEQYYVEEAWIEMDGRNVKVFRTCECQYCRDYWERLSGET